MQVAPVSFSPDAAKPRLLDETVKRNLDVQVQPAAEQPLPKIIPDMTTIGAVADADTKTAQEDWQKVQASKAATVAKAGEAEESSTDMSGTMADDLAAIALAAQSGDATAVLAAQQRLAQHVLKL